MVSTTSTTERQSISDLATDLRLTKGDVPPPIVGASATALNNHIYVFGGRVGSLRQMTNHLYILDLTTLTWIRYIAPPDSASPPVPRYFHSATPYADRYIVIFGGMANVNQKLCAMDDISIFDTQTMTWTNLSIEPNLFTPQARYAHLATIWESNKLVITGGQDLANQHIHDMHVFDLEEKTWISGTSVQGTHDAYRTITFDTQESALANRVCIYSNYNFSDINRDLMSLNPKNPQDIKNHADEMTGSTLPPGLRFPTGYVMGHYFIMSGTYLSANHRNFQIWVMDLRTLAWTPIDTGHGILTGSWNRGLLVGKKFYVLGHSQRDLKEDYSYRRINFDHIAVVDLEAFGVCVPPPSSSPIAQELGLFLLNTPGLGDVVIWTTDQKSILANSTILSERWSGFASLLQQKDEDSKIEKKQIMFPETHAVTLAFLQYIYTDNLVAEQPLVLCRLLILADMHDIQRLKELSTYALHNALSISTASSIYETATLALQVSLQIRALKMMIHAKRIILKQMQQQKNNKNVNISPSSSSGYLSDQEPSSPTLSAYSSFSSLRRLASSSSQKSSHSLKSPPFNPVALNKIHL